MEKEGEAKEMRGKKRKVVAEVFKSSLTAVLFILSIFCTDLDCKYKLSTNHAFNITWWQLGSNSRQDYFRH